MYLKNLMRIGRLLDLISKSYITLERLHYIVFDEVDRLLSDNYKDHATQNEGLGPMEQQLRNFLSCCTICPHQTSLFSATVPAR